MKQWTSKVGKVQDIAMRSRVASGGLVSEAQWSTSKQNWYIYKQHRRLIRVAIFTPMVPSNISYNHRGYNPVISWTPWTPWTHHGSRHPGHRDPEKARENYEQLRCELSGEKDSGPWEDPKVFPFRWVKIRLGSANPSTIGVATWGVESRTVSDSHRLTFAECLETAAAKGFRLYGSRCLHLFLVLNLFPGQGPKGAKLNQLTLPMHFESKSIADFTESQECFFPFSFLLQSIFSLIQKKPDLSGSTSTLFLKSRPWPPSWQVRTHGLGVAACAAPLLPCGLRTTSQEGEPWNSWAHQLWKTGRNMRHLFLDSSNSSNSWIFLNILECLGANRMKSTHQTSPKPRLCRSLQFWICFIAEPALFSAPFFV